MGWDVDGCKSKSRPRSGPLGVTCAGLVWSGLAGLECV